MSAGQLCSREHLFRFSQRFSQQNESQVKPPSPLEYDCVTSGSLRPAYHTRSAPLKPAAESGSKPVITAITDASHCYRYKKAEGIGLFMNKAVLACQKCELLGVSYRQVYAAARAECGLCSAVQKRHLRRRLASAIATAGRLRVRTHTGPCHTVCVQSHEVCLAYVREAHMYTQAQGISGFEK